LIGDVESKRSTPTRRGTKPQTFGEYLDEWLTHATDSYSPSTVRGYRSHIDQIKLIEISPRKKLGAIELRKLTAQNLDAAYAKWLKGGKSQATVRHRHNVIGVALAQAVRWGKLPTDISDKAAPPPLRTRPIPRVLSTTVREFITEAEKRNPTLVAAIALAAVLGARRGELCGLRWSDVAADDVLAIERSAKKNLEGAVTMGDVKNHQPRYLALDVFALAVLRQHRASMEELARAHGVVLSEDAYVLTPTIRSRYFDPTGRTPLPPDYITHAHRDAAAALGLKVRFHDLRHFAATELIAAKVDPKTAAGRLGHDPIVLMKTYAALVDENDREAANVLGRVLGPL
jgi:integrase